MRGEQAGRVESRVSSTQREREDLFDVVEWIAAQPWCDGNVGMLGISYFAMTQLAAAVERPPAPGAQGDIPGRRYR